MSWGMYGLRVSGFRNPSAVLGRAEPHWPLLTVTQERPAAADQRPADVEVASVRWDDRSAHVWLSDTDSLAIDRSTMRVTFTTRAPVDDEVLAHPNIALPIAVASHWLQRQVLHGAALMLDGRAWGVLGGKEAGKSTTAAWFHRHGHCVLSDDLLVIDGTMLFAGPRCIDLRAEAAAVLGGQAVELIGRPKWRLRPGTVPGSVPLAGFIHLEWGDEVLIESLRPVERLQRIIENFVLGPDLADAVAYLELAALPAYRFVRPQKIDSVDVANGQLLDRLG